jgi:hypothetical protein
MNPKPFNFTRKTVSTPSGVISYVEHGAGPVALFIHGALLNGHLGRHQLQALADARRCTRQPHRCDGPVEAMLMRPFLANGKAVFAGSRPRSLVPALGAVGGDPLGPSASSRRSQDFEVFVSKPF